MTQKNRLAQPTALKILLKMCLHQSTWWIRWITVINLVYLERINRTYLPDTGLLPAKPIFSLSNNKNLGFSYYCYYSVCSTTWHTTYKQKMFSRISYLYPIYSFPAFINTQQESTYYVLPDKKMQVFSYDYYYVNNHSFVLCSCTTSPSQELLIYYPTKKGKCLRMYYCTYMRTDIRTCNAVVVATWYENTPAMILHIYMCTDTYIRVMVWYCTYMRTDIRIYV